MLDGWRQTELGNVLTLQRGFDLPIQERREGNIPVVSSSGITGKHSKAMVTAPGVITGRYGTIGQIFFLTENFWPLNTTLFVKDFKGNDPLFVYYLLKTIDFASCSDKSSVPGVNRNHLHSLRVSVPESASEQRAIAQILGALDDKVELNRRMNETLEAMAGAIFNRAFPASEQDYVEASHLISQGVLQIGDGYRAKNEELGDEGLPFIRASNLNNGFDTESAERLRPESVAKAGPKLGKVGDVAFTSKGTIGRFARVGEGTDPFVYSPQVCYWRSLDPQTLQPIVLYCWMNTADFKRQIDAVAGQTDMAPYVSLQDQRRFKVPRFSDSQHEIALCLAPLVAKQSLNTVESRSLVTLRDALLPKLISGEIRVNDGENAGVEVR